MSDSDSKTRLRTFTERILRIQPQYADVFGKGVPGMAGSSAASVATSNGQSDFWLQRNALAFAKAVSEGDIAEAQRLAKEVEGGLLLAVTLDALSEKGCGPLLDELQALTPKQ